MNTTGKFRIDETHDTASSTSVVALVPTLLRHVADTHRAWVGGAQFAAVLLPFSITYSSETALPAPEELRDGASTAPWVYEYQIKRRRISRSEARRMAWRILKEAETRRRVAAEQEAAIYMRLMAIEDEE